MIVLEDRVNPAPLLPDLVVQADDLAGQWYINTPTGGGREIRFTTSMGNAGQGAFELRSTPEIITLPDGTLAQQVNQRIFQSQGGYTETFAGYFTYHASHGHMHFDDMAFANLRLRLPGDIVGDIVATGEKTSFCLIDLDRFMPTLPGSPTSPGYSGCNSTFQGISVGWSDIYNAGLDGQSINLTGIPNGNYFLEVVCDPSGAIQETNNNNNVTRVPITINNLPAVGFRVQSSTPVGAQNNPVSFVEFDFNQAVLESSFTTSAVTVNGPGGAIPITSVTKVDSVTYRANFATQTVIGTYSVTLLPVVRSASGALLDQNGNGTGGEPGDSFVGIFTVTAPRVNSVTPAGTVAPPVNSVRVTYNRPMVSNTFTTDDIFSFTGPGGANLLGQVTGITPVTAGTSSQGFDINFASPLTAPGAYSMILEPTVFDSNGYGIDQNADGVSNSLDRFTANFAIAVPSQVGPDAFGYDGLPTALMNVELVGQPNTTTVTFSNTDDGFAAINLGTNTFNFYGTTYTGASQLFVSTNGLLTFGVGSTAWDNNAGLSSLTIPAIAVLWDDWRRGSTTVPQVLYRLEDSDGVAGIDRIVIEWNQVWHRGTTAGTATFMAILGLNTGNTPGKIVLNYPDLLTENQFANGVSATVGLRRPGTKAVPFVVSQNGTNSMIADDQAVRLGVPVVSSITRLDGNPVNAGLMEYAVTFDHPVTGVDLTDFTLTTTGGITGAVVDHIHSSLDPAVYHVHVRSGSGAGTLKLNLIDDGTITSTSGAQLGGVGTGNGTFTNGEIYNVVQPPSQVMGVNIDDGTQQRSVVRKIQIVFNQLVTFVGDPANAFVITGPNGNVVPTVDLSGSNPNQTIVKLTFTGAGALHGSLLDGEYFFRILAANVLAGGVPMTNDYTMGFHRYFGDVNGDRRVDIADFGQFNLAYGSETGQSNYREYWDFNNDGRIDILDFGQFSLRYSSKLP